MLPLTWGLWQHKALSKIPFVSMIAEDAPDTFLLSMSMYSQLQQLSELVDKARVMYSMSTS